MQKGGGMPRHTNTVEHEQYVLRGEATITIGEETHRVKAGDVVFIPAGAAHSYENMGDGAFEFLCIVPNEEDKITIVGDPVARAVSPRRVATRGGSGDTR